MTATRAMVDPATFSRKVTRGLPMGEPDRLGQAIALRWLPVRGYCLRATQAGNVSRVKRRSTRSLDM